MKAWRELKGVIPVVQTPVKASRECPGSRPQRKSFDKLILPEEKFCTKIKILQRADWERDPLALAGEFRYVDQLLFHKVFYDVKLHERRPATDANMIAKMHSDPWSELCDTLVAIARSPIISLGMKLIALPTLLAARCWYGPKNKGVVAKTLRCVLPATHYDALKRLYRAVRPGAMLPSKSRGKKI